MKRLLILLALTGFFTACKEKNKPQLTYCEQNPVGCTDIQGVKDYFLFKMGSWWVYEEETSGERDSVYVTESLNNPTNYDFDLRVYSTYQGYFYHYFPNFASGSHKCETSGLVSANCVSVKRSKYKPGDYIGEGICFLFTYKVNDWQYVPNTSYDNNKITITNVETNYNLGNLSFPTTVKIYETNTYIEDKQSTNHYFSKGVGLIRKELIDSNQVWNLVNYHIS